MRIIQQNRDTHTKHMTSLTNQEMINELPDSPSCVLGSTATQSREDNEELTNPNQLKPKLSKQDAQGGFPQTTLMSEAVTSAKQDFRKHNLDYLVIHGPFLYWFILLCVLYVFALFRVFISIVC